jgi:hypothetical protein
VCEEPRFRGYVFPALSRWCRLWAAPLITGAVSGAGHPLADSPLACVPLAVLAIGLCRLCWRTGSLLPCRLVRGLNTAAGHAAGDHLALWLNGVLIGAAPVAILALMGVLAGSDTVRVLLSGLAGQATASSARPIAKRAPADRLGTDSGQGIEAFGCRMPQESAARIARLGPSGHIVTSLRGGVSTNSR